MRWVAALLAALWLCWPAAAAAAEVLQVRGPSLLQLGDQNRSYTVQLACIAVAEPERDEALQWLRRQVPRHTRVNLRPMGQSQGVLLAGVQVISTGEDLAGGLIAAGLAEPDPTGPEDCAKVGA